MFTVFFCGNEKKKAFNFVLFWLSDCWSELRERERESVKKVFSFTPFVFSNLFKDGGGILGLTTHLPKSLF